MKVFVDQDTCISCGMCVSACNEVVVDVVPPELEEDAGQAAQNCPVEAITKTE